MEFIKTIAVWLNANSGLLTLLTALATFLTCWYNYKSAKATQDQVSEMQRQFSEENRPYIDVEFLYEKRLFYGLRFINNGKRTAQQVKISFDTEFIDSLTEKKFADLLKKQIGKTCVIGVGQHYDLFIGTKEYHKNPHKMPAKGIVRYESNNTLYESEFFIDLANYATIFSVHSEREDFSKNLTAQIVEIKGIRHELKRISNSIIHEDE